MSKSMEDWFKEQDFNTTELPSGHRNRFLERLQAAQEDEKVVSIDRDGKAEGHADARKNPWFKWSLVAGLALLMGLAGFNLGSSNDTDLASVSPEMANAQDFFSSTIAEELKQLESESSPETERLIADTKVQLLELENDYQQLKLDLDNSGNSRKVIAAMIQNFQNRIALLEAALEHIESLKQLKLNTDATIL
ncbi:MULTISPECIES: hypothetical protein [Nonlabens]|uniref:hypothetical protein n=1 Tax=Nonlabens TaxID=363408 RepID=UPI002941D3F1|nr:hypothetical protein [Nonlabens ulvanivorans]WOI23613.1 hypothetical protein R1T42_03970 [Nonlabens ulvanivorans]